jgi:hypothetical protein
MPTKNLSWKYLSFFAQWNTIQRSDRNWPAYVLCILIHPRNRADVALPAGVDIHG